MNRAQRRAAIKAGKLPKGTKAADLYSAQSAQDIVDSLTTPQIVAGINNLLEQLEKRGKTVADWDNDKRKLYRLQIKRNNVFYLATDNLNKGE